MSHLHTKAMNNSQQQEIKWPYSNFAVANLGENREGSCKLCSDNRTAWTFVDVPNHYGSLSDEQKHIVWSAMGEKGPPWAGQMWPTKCISRTMGNHPVFHMPMEQRPRSPRDLHVWSCGADSHPGKLGSFP